MYALALRCDGGRKPCGSVTSCCVGCRDGWRLRLVERSQFEKAVGVFYYKGR